jgi:hypothetical protein
MLRGLLGLESRLDRVLTLLEDPLRSCNRASISPETPKGRKGGEEEN